jgi:hypothetical protein
LTVQTSLGSPPDAPDTVVVEGLSSEGHLRVLEVLEHFPELAGKHLRYRWAPKLLSCTAYVSGDVLSFAQQTPSYHVIAHETMHVVQGLRVGVPCGERSCDLWTIARADLFNDVPPCYLRVPVFDTISMYRAVKPVMRPLALQAIEERARGNRRYLVWWERRVLEYAESQYPPGSTLVKWPRLEAMP